MNSTSGYRNIINFLSKYNVRPSIIYCAILTLAILFCYWTSLSKYYTDIDDSVYVRDNFYVGLGVTKEGILWALRTATGGSWHPVTWLSHMIDVQLYGLNAFGHRFTNVLFHIANSIIVFFILRKATLNITASYLVAFLFAVHPMHVESVAWISERKDVLCAFFFMVTIYYYIEYINNKIIFYYYASLFFFIASLMSKPMSVTLPFALLLLDYWPLKRFRFFTRKEMLGAIYEKISFFIFTIVFCIITFYTQKDSGAVMGLDKITVHMRIYNILTSYVLYIKRIFFPYNLAVLYPYPTTIIIWQFILSFGILVCITFFAIRKRKPFPWFFVGWFWYIGTLIPVIGIVHIGFQASADRYTYIPLIGIFMILSWGIHEILHAKKYRNIIYTIIIIILFFLSITCRMQSAYWKNSIDLFQHALKVTNGNYFIHGALGVTYAHLGDKNNAVTHLKESMRINPMYEASYMSYGKTITVFKIQTEEQIISFYDNALREKPNFSDLRYDFSVFLFQSGRFNDALQHLIEVKRSKPNLGTVYNDMGVILALQGKKNIARFFLEKSLGLDPYNANVKENIKKIFK